MVNIEKNKQFLETEEKIENVYLELRRKLPIDKITVSQICKEAKINRSSFYYHFFDVYDLNEQLTFKVNERLAEKMIEIGRDFLSRDNLMVYFQHIKEERETYAILMNARVQFPIKRSYEQFKSYLLRKDRFRKQTPEQLELSIIYIQAGFHHMIRQWVESGCEVSVDEMVDLFLEELR